MLFNSDLKLIPFDAEGQLGKQSAKMQFDQSFIEWLNHNGIATNNSVIHFVDESCACYEVSKVHRQSVEALAEFEGMVNRHVNWDDSMKQMIPASPAVAVISESGQLVYLGPYSSGAFCTADNGLVEPFIKSERQAMPGAMVVTDSVGCYCNRSQAQQG